MLIISLSVGYYFVIFLPEKEKSQLAAKKIEEGKQRQQREKEYIAKRKSECYTIYEKEREKWSNIRESHYDEKEDVCRITYEAVQGEWKDDNCEDYRPTSSSTFSITLSRMYLECKSNTFSKEF